MKNAKSLVLAGLALISVGIASAQTSIAPGETVTPVPAIVDWPNDLGTIIDVIDAAPFIGTDVFDDVVFTGWLTSYVIQENDGDLVFGYIVKNDVNSQDSLGRLTLTDFSGFTTAVAQGSPWNPPYIPVDLATRSMNGRVVSFEWLDGIDPGVEARFVYVFTDAKNYIKGSASVINGGVASVDTFAPAPVPEPASIAVLGLGAVALIRRRRNR